MNIIDAIVKGVLVGLFMAISVGPTLFAVIRYSMSFSPRAGIAFILGVSVSDIMFVSLANLAAPLLSQLKPYEKHIAFGGAVLLMGMGFVGFLRKRKVKRPTADVAITGGKYIKIWTAGFLVNTLNPGALITWLGAVTLTLNASVSYRFVLFGTCLAIILSIDFSKVLLASRIKKMLTVKRMYYLQLFSSACLVLIGVSIFATTLISSLNHTPAGKKGIDKILSK